MPIDQTNEKELFSYAMAMNFAASLIQLPIELDFKVVAAAAKELLEGAQPELSPEVYHKAMNDLRAQLQEKARAEADKMAVENLEEGNAFLAENAKKEGVFSTETGLQMKTVTEGEGKSPSATDTVKVHYEGRLLNGKTFDSSIQRGEPVEFPLNHVIPGWTEGLQLMKEGGKAVFYISSSLAYGERGAGEHIPPNSTLIFEVELIEVK